MNQAVSQVYSGLYSFLLERDAMENFLSFDLNRERLISWAEAMHYAAIESNRELKKSLEVVALLLLIFGPNLIILCFPGVKP